jgi:hypothetical protein
LNFGMSIGRTLVLDEESWFIRSSWVKLLSIFVFALMLWFLEDSSWLELSSFVSSSLEISSFDSFDSVLVLLRTLLWAVICPT